MNATDITQPQDSSRNREVHAVQRVDPFVLPPDTPFRFGLLLLAILSTSLFAYQMLFLVVHDDEFVDTYLRCGLDPPDGQVPEASTAARASASLCRQGFERSEARWMLAGVALLAVVSIGFLFAIPWLRSRRHTYVLVDDRESPEIASALRALAERAGTPGIDFFVDPFDSRTSAFSFGRPGRRRVVLRGGLVTLLVTDRPSFEAIVLHELGHVRNHDIDQTYVSLTTFAAFILVAVLPFAAVLRGGLPVWPMLWRFAVLTLIVYLLFAALIRSRERYADARARQWSTGDGLASVLGRAEQHPQRRLTRVVALHPAPHARAQALADPAPLFRLTFVDALAVGLVASLAMPQLVFVVGLITGASLGSPAWAAIPVAPLVAGFLTVGIWRQRYREASAGVVRRPVWRLGVGLGVGFALGPTLSINATGDSFGLSLTQGLVWHMVWAAIVTLLVAPIASWMASGATGTTMRHAQHAAASQRLVIPCLVAFALVAWATGYLLYRLYQVRLFAMTPPDGSDLSETGGHVLEMTRAMLDPSVLWSWPDIAAFAAVLCLPWVAVGVGWPAIRRAAAAGSLAVITLPSLVVVSVYYARELPLEERWPLSFSLDMNLFWMFAATPVVCALAAGAAAAMFPRRALAGASIAVVTAAGFAFAVFALLRPARSCLGWLNVAPFSNDPEATSRCPSFSPGSFLGDLLPYVLAGALSATIITAPSFAAAGRGLRTRTARLSPGERRITAAFVIVALVVAAVVGTRLAANRAVDRARAASVDLQPVDIGAQGLVQGSGYRVRLVPGWVDVTQEVAPRNPDLPIDRVFTDTAPSDAPAQVVVFHFENAPGTRNSVRDDESLRPQETMAIDGEAAVLFTTPNRPKELHVEVVTEHGAHQYVITLRGRPREFDETTRHMFDDLLRSWEWETQ